MSKKCHDHIDRLHEMVKTVKTVRANFKAGGDTAERKKKKRDNIPHNRH